MCKLQNNVVYIFRGKLKFVGPICVITDYTVVIVSSIFSLMLSSSSNLWRRATSSIRRDGQFAHPFTTSVTISISILQTYRSWVATSRLLPPKTFLSHNSSDTPGFAPLMSVLFWGMCGFPINFSRKICQGTFEIVSYEVLWSVQGSYETIWSPSLPNVITARDFNRRFARGAACQQQMLTSSDIWEI